MEGENMEEEKIPEMKVIEKTPGFNWVQIVLAMGVVIALIFASWNAFSIMGTDKEMNAEDSDLSSEIEAVDSSLSSSINVLDNNTSNQISSLSDSIGALDGNMSGQIITLDGRISDLQNKLTQEKDYLIDMLESLNSTLQGEIDTLQNNVSVLEGDITEIDTEIDSIQTDIQGLQDQIDNLNSRIVILEQACDLDDDGIFDKYDDDDDGDGYNDTEDAFPNDATEWKDNDNDGIGDNADPDDDNDGWEDWNDYLPYKDAKMKITVISFTLEDSNDDVFFEIYADGNTIRSPVFWDCPNGWEYWVNWECEFNIDDSWESVLIFIDMYDLDIDVGKDYLDIEGKSSSFYLYLEYNIVTGEWTGDDDDGYSSGFDDGRTGESDVLFSYNIKTI